LVRREGGRPALLGRRQQRGTGLLPGQRDLRVVVRLPHLTHRLVAREGELVLSHALRRLGQAQLVAPLEALEQRPLEAEPGVPLLGIDRGVRTALEVYPPDVAAGGATNPELGKELGARVAHLSLLRAERGQPGEEVGALRQGAVDRVVHRFLRPWRERLLRYVDHP